MSYYQHQNNTFKNRNHSSERSFNLIIDPNNSKITNNKKQHYNYECGKVNYGSNFTWKQKRIRKNNNVLLIEGDLNSFGKFDSTKTNQHISNAYKEYKVINNNTVNLRQENSKACLDTLKINIKNKNYRGNYFTKEYNHKLGSKDGEIKNCSNNCVQHSRPQRNYSSKAANNINYAKYMTDNHIRNCNYMRNEGSVNEVNLPKNKTEILLNKRKSMQSPNANLLYMTGNKCFVNTEKIRSRSANTRDKLYPNCNDLLVNKNETRTRRNNLNQSPVNDKKSAFYLKGSKISTGLNYNIRSKSLVDNNRVNLNKISNNLFIVNNNPQSKNYGVNPVVKNRQNFCKRGKKNDKEIIINDTDIRQYSNKTILRYAGSQRNTVNFNDGESVKRYKSNNCRGYNLSPQTYQKYNIINNGNNKNKQAINNIIVNGFITFIKIILFF